MTPFVFVLILVCSFIQTVLSASDSSNIPAGEFLHYGPFTGSGTIDIKVLITSGGSFDFFVADSKTYYVNEEPNYLKDCPNGRKKTAITGTCAVPADGKEYYCLVVNDASSSIGVDWTFNYITPLGIIIPIVIGLAVFGCVFVRIRKRRKAPPPPLATENPTYQ